MLKRMWYQFKCDLAIKGIQKVDEAISNLQEKRRKLVLSHNKYEELKRSD